MRFVNYASGDGPRAGLLREGRVVEVLGAPPGGLQALVEAGSLGAVEAGDEGPNAELLPPIHRPGKIICIGLNYRAHAEEGGREAPETPAVFAQVSTSLRAAGATIELPSWSQKVDYEAEVAFVIGSVAREVPAAQALDHVAGYSLFNDLSARDYQFKTPQWMPGKAFDASAPFGPALVTLDEV